MKNIIKLVSVLFVVFISVYAVADDNFSFVASEDVSYDDNIYLEAKGKEQSSSVRTTRILSEYTTRIPNSSVSFRLSGSGGYTYFADNSSKNSFYDAMGQVEASNRLISVADKFVYTSDQANSSLTERAKRMQNIGSVSFRTSNSKILGVGVFGDDVFDSYIDSEYKNLNRNRAEVGGRLFYNITSKTNIYGEFRYSDITYRETSAKGRDSVTESAALGVNGKISSKVTGTAKISYDMRQYDKIEPNLDREINNLGYVASVEWFPTNQTKIHIAGSRKLEEVYYGNNRYFKDTMVSLTITQKILNRISLSASGVYENMAYDVTVSDVKRKDNVFVARPEIQYNFKDTFFVGFWYNFRKRDSNVATVDYDNNKFGGFVKILL